ncbi:hypothetical protein NDU88_007862 [Pleurodeles waltl]|uniref:Uncharacterized protein n=1 Tax=Pleurodeles waltl TaxID=8319 RepID=A0AAV7RRB6_PLEWA|nr:hypothetical protein NDU88_007862 [Pleurodeles waltl]
MFDDDALSSPIKCEALERGVTLVTSSVVSHTGLGSGLGLASFRAAPPRELIKPSNPAGPMAGPEFCGCNTSTKASSAKSSSMKLPPATKLLPLMTPSSVDTASSVNGAFTVSRVDIVKDYHVDDNTIDNDYADNLIIIPN